ncbi:MAG: FAD-linked oxidase C-terminal domain-containing protein [Dermatophilaceae bacterium]
MDPIAELVATLPDGVVVTEPAMTEKYRHDWAKDPSAGLPRAVVRATTADQLQTAVRWAAAYGIPVVPRGAGSGLSGGASARDDGIVVTLERMRHIEIDTGNRVAIVEPGAFNAEVKAAARAHGLWYPPDPSSYEICSIGGNVATNAGGLCCVKYGVTVDYVMGLDVVLADGRLITLGGRRIKDVAGLPLTKLFVGSEGTLGIVTRAILRLVPVPETPATLVATFPSVAAAADAVLAVCRSTRPSMVELMDRATINAVEDYQPMGLDRAAGALLLMQSDAHVSARGAEVDAMSSVCRASGAIDVFTTEDPAEGEMFVQARRLAFPATEARGSLLLEDVGAPLTELPGLLADVSTIGVEFGVDVYTVAHAGDGNTHPIIVVPPGDLDAAARAEEAFAAIMAAAIRRGGTITGEHGVGRLKRAALPAQLGPDVMDLTLRIKTALDPQGILNPGAAF